MKKQKKPQIHLPHGKPVTRRDFLASGIMPFAGYFMAPTLFNLFAPKKAQAAVTGAFPFFVADFAGGIAFCRNFIVGGPGDNPMQNSLPSYNQLGFASTPANIRTDYGAPMPANAPFLTGLERTLPQQYRANLRFGTYCHQTQDDTPTNKHSALLLVSNVANGRYIPTGLGTEPTVSGGYTDVPQQIAKLRPVQVQNVNAVLSGVSVQGPMGQISEAAQLAWARASRSLAEVQAKHVSEKINGPTFADFVQTGFSQHPEYIQGVQGMDPRFDADMNTVFNINTGSAANAMNVRIATIVMNVLKGNTGPGCLTFGGYDYHNAGNDNFGPGVDVQKDIEAGERIGQIIHAAALAGKPVMIQLVTDGATTFDQGTTFARGDGGQLGMTVLAYYNPNGQPSMVRQQVGHFTNGQAAALDTIIGRDETLVAYAVFANYLNVIGLKNEFANLGQRVFNPLELDSVLLFS